MIKHSCIKCRTQYEDEEVDAYYCPSCVEERNRLAAQIDARVGSTVGQEPNGFFKEMESGVDYKGIKFLKA